MKHMKTRIRFLLKISALLAMALSASFGCEELGKLIETNEPPVVDQVVALRSSLFPADTTTIKVEAHDPEGGALSFAWSAAGGTLSSTTGSHVRWTAPAVAGDYKISVKVRDDKNDEAEGAVTLPVIAVEQPTVEIIQPKQNAFIPGIGVIVIEALASHPNGIERVEFRAGGNLLGIDNSPPYQQPWRVEGLSGPATIVISAYRALTPGAPGVDSVRVSVEGVTRL
ncbi:hypothetical protein EDS67_14105 [candidate division KSB1 bacterium]|nr:MAG: hypothetical protein EDS67_14105 [candidate division KSB1 bacterium]